ncbi:MAG TPA: 4-oxalocrotonate tautomerase family protein [Trebonia sp.]|nr:4-oxalocrotonate tautomerase family protein [Trebonia sp.]
MPIVNVKVIEEVTPEQKLRLIRGITELLHQVLVKDPERIYVVIDEVPLANWAAGGYSVEEMRAQGKNGRCGCALHTEKEQTP